MKWFYKTFTGLCLLFFAGCAGPQINYVARVKLNRLEKKDLYNSKMVFDVLFDSEELNTDSLKNNSRRLFLQGVDQFKNKHNLPKAIELFKSSILVLPDAKAYYELANALMTLGSNDRADEALKALEVAEALNFTPASLIYYKEAAAYCNLQQPDYGTAGYLIRRAFENGFRDTAALRSDKQLAGFITRNEYQGVLRYMVTNQFKGGPDNLFNLFKNSFPAVNTPFEIVPAQVNMHDYKQSISYDFVKFVPEMESSSFGRSVSNDFIFVARLSETPYYCALLYTSAGYFGEELQPVYTKLVTYSPEGKIIAAKLFSGQFSAERIKTGRFENNQITIKDYKRIWSQPIDKVPFEQNTVKDYELQATAVFRIDDTGKILEESVPKDFKDSLILVKR